MVSEWFGIVSQVLCRGKIHSEKSTAKSCEAGWDPPKVGIRTDQSSRGGPGGYRRGPEQGGPEMLYISRSSQAAVCRRLREMGGGRARQEVAPGIGLLGLVLDRVG